MTEERDVVVYMTRWCGACATTMRFLKEHGIPYRTVDIDGDTEAAQVVMALNRGNRSVPTIMVDGKHVLTEPSMRELAAIFVVAS